MINHVGRADAGKRLHIFSSGFKTENLLAQFRAMVQRSMPKGGNVAIEFRHDAAIGHILHYGGQGYDAPAGKRLHQQSHGLLGCSEPLADVGN